MFAAVTCALRSCRMSTRYAFEGLNNIATPTPLSHRHTKFSNIGAVPDQNWVRKPDTSTEPGARMRALMSVERRRSSGTHLPPRRLRSATMNLSESRPAYEEPTRGKMGC